jgi:hypothetical protein
MFLKLVNLCKMDDTWYRPNESDNSRFPNETFPDEDDAIEAFREGHVPSKLDELLINPWDRFEEFHVSEYIDHLPGMITPRTKYEQYAILDKDEFTKRWERYGEIFGSGFNWSNVVIAGGYALRMIDSTNTDVHGGKLSDESDIDLFLYGLDEQAALEKVEYILAYFEDYNYGRTIENTSKAIEDYRNIKDIGILVRTERSLTIIVPGVNRPIQLILRLYTSIAEILLNFDLPCVRIAFDGTNIHMLKSAQNALVNRYNLATGYQPFRTGTYEYRLTKYFKRGFAIRVPNFHPDRIKPELLDVPDRKIPEYTGLLKLVCILKNKSYEWSSARLIGDYDPMRHLMFEITDVLNDTSNPLRAVGRIDYGILKEEQGTSFRIEIYKHNWPRIFKSEWRYQDVNRDLHPDETYENREYMKDQPKFGPVKFIGSTIEYMQGLPAPVAWYCQAYGITTEDCLM